MNAGRIQNHGHGPRAQVAAGPGPAGARSGAGGEVVGPDSGPERRSSTQGAVSNHRLVELLATSALFHEFQRAFEDATRLPLTLRAVESWKLAHSESKKQNGFCALMSESNHSCAACLQVQQRVCEGIEDAPFTMSCTFGLSETAVGVKVGRGIIGYLQTGQVFFKRPTTRQTQHALHQIKEWGLTLDREEVVRRYRETRVVPRSEYEATARLLQFFADQLGPLAGQIALRQEKTEPAHIARARKMIQERYGEKLSLVMVARQSGMSPFYFCKSFKKITGLKLTQYISRVRVEKAKDLLLNVNYRVTEVGFAVGFQSVTNFNRVFKSVAGESPTEFRQHLPGV
jgi:AraC-like DNA-binding protein/ligand-binding sensor protein